MDKNILQNFNGSTPILPLSDFVLFPQTGHRFEIFEPRYLEMMQDVFLGNKLITLTLLQPGWENNYEGSPPIQTIGTLGLLDEYKKIEPNKFEAIIYGIKKVEINEATKTFTYRRAAVTIIEDNVQIPHEKILRKRLISNFSDILGLSNDYIDISLINKMSLNTEMLTNLICSMIPMDINEKQKFLELQDVSLRLDVINHLIESELEKKTQYNNILHIFPLNSKLN